LSDLGYIKTKGESLENASELLNPSLISIRVSPHNYLVAIFLGTFFSAFFFYLELDLAGIILFCISWIALPFFALNDRIVFDGRRLSRAGLLPRFWSWLNGSRRRLKLTDVEQVETQTIRTLRRGGKVFYRYRTAVCGKGLRITVVSGGENYRKMIRAILPLLAGNVLDNRSIELRDHLTDPKETLMNAEFSRIPSAEGLDGLLNDLRTRGRHKPPPFNHVMNPEDDVKAEELRGLGNELRVAGYPLRALESFRRAFVLRRPDGRLLFEFARCLQSFAGAERDSRLERRSLAAMRLAERRADGDIDLLARLGECYFQLGEWRRAARVFQNAMDRAGESFRVARGMADIALHDGKIAHVIHHFSAANRVAETPSLRRWSKGEAEYFSHLNSDDEYMEMEISRVNLLETIEASKKTALRISYFAFPIIIVGLVFDDSLISNIGWAVSAVSLLIWVGMQMSTRLLGQRIPYELVESDD
jgi:tetratricopeptide (TPR) repeat protein